MSPFTRRPLAFAGCALTLIVAIGVLFDLPAPAQATAQRPSQPASRPTVRQGPTAGPNQPARQVRPAGQTRRTFRRPRRRIRRLAPTPAAAAQPQAASIQSSVPRQISDAIDLSQDASRKAHAVETSGTVRHESTRVGNLDLPVAGIRLRAGDRLKAVLDAPGARHGMSLLVTLATDPSDYGRRQAYRVRVNGRAVLFAVDTDPGGGTARSFFIDFTAPGPKVNVEVEAELTTEAPVTVSSLRCYSGLSRAAVEKSLLEGAARDRMGLALVSPKDGGYTIDVETIRTLFRSLPASPYLEEQVAVLYNFSSRDVAENRAEIERLAAMAQQTDVPLRIAFQVHWGGVPRGVSDGAGGTFTDLPYQQISFDPEDKVEDPGLAALMGDRNDIRYGLSVPNVWNDTPWLTFNHPRLNQLRRIRLTQALTAWREQREKLAAAGKARLLPGQLSTGDESIYWATGVDDRKFTELNGGAPRAQLAADFNPFTVADALKDGVNLDPRDGLDQKERVWLHRNLAQQQQRLIDWMYTALPAEPIRLSRGGPQYGVDLVRRNLYTEPYGLPVFPLKENDPYHPGLELGFVKKGRSGGQFWSGEMLPWLLKSRERGRIAVPNFECTGAPPPQLIAGLRSAYACGARFATIYNWNKGTETLKALRSFAGSIQRTAAEEYLPAASGPTIGVGKRWVREYSAGPEAFGINRVDFYGIEIPQSTAATLTLRGADGELTVPGVLQKAAGRPALSIFSLPTLFPQRPGQKYTVTLEIDSVLPPSVALASDGQIAVRLVGDIAHERARSRVIAEWQDAEDILEAVREVHKTSVQPVFAVDALIKAQTMMKDARPRDAYAAAIRAEQLALPATYMVPAPGGRLTPYWVNIDCPGGPVTATITAYDTKAAMVSVRSAVAQTVTLFRGSLKTTAALSPDVPAEVSVDITPPRPVFRPRVRRASVRPRGRPAGAPAAGSKTVQPPRQGPPLPANTPLRRP